MATTKAKKGVVLEKVRTYLQESKNLVLTEYRGMNVEQVTVLRATLRKAGVKYKIVKIRWLRSWPRNWDSKPGPAFEGARGRGVSG